jgi:YVTN family beta-propeller protein
MKSAQYAVIVLVLLSLVVCGCSSSKGRSAASTTTQPGSTAPPTSATPPSQPTQPGTPVQPPTPVGEAYVTNFMMNQVEHFELTNPIHAKATIATGELPSDVAVYKNTAYVANSKSQSVTVVDVLTGTVSTTVDLKTVPILGLPAIGGFNADTYLAYAVRPAGIAVTPNGKKVYVANLITTVGIDTATNKPTKSIVGFDLSGAIAMIFGGGSGSLTSLFAIGQAKVACNDQYAVVTNMVTGNVTIIDVATDSIVKHVQVGGLPTGVAIAQNKAFVACTLDGTVVPVDLGTRTAGAPITVGDGPFDVTASASGDKVYVSAMLLGEISVISAASAQVIDTLPAGINMASLLTQFGITQPGSGGTIGSLFQGFLTQILGSLTSGSSSGFASLLNTILGGANGGAGGILTGLLGQFMTSVLGLPSGWMNTALPTIPGVGTMGVDANKSGAHVASANGLFFGLCVTDTQTRAIDFLMGQPGMGPAEIAVLK